MIEDVLKPVPLARLTVDCRMVARCMETTLVVFLNWTMSMSLACVTIMSRK